MRMRWRGFELPTRVEVEEETHSDTYGKFVAEPFERGYGITVGNSLRRVLLSSIEGVAPVSVLFEGATHEFTAIPGIYEDVTNIILNLKGLLMKMRGDGPEIIKIHKTGAGEVKGGDIETNQNIEIINPDHLIATIVDEKATFSAELTVARGRGYKTSEELINPEMPLGTIPMDAAFSPVRRTRWSTEDTRVGKMTNYDRLILEIWTNGTVKPEEALVEASTILRKHLVPFVKYFDIGEELEQETLPDQESAYTEMTTEDQELLAKLSEPVSVLDPSVRAANCLSAEGIKTLFDLVKNTESDMLQVRNFGKTSLKEIKAKLAEAGLSFGMEVAKFKEDK
ncbi:MAG: DNA-directed RNA polymerase subunit alpha [Planctomycetes bacterium]|nr:DNA-directed RNA polymerase subunit alpha [Planctomycetota bacterium]